MKIKRYLFILIYASSVFALMATQDNVKTDNLDGLRSAFSLEKTDHLSPFDLGTIYVAFDLGEQTLPFLEGILADHDKERSYLIAHSIAYIGGTRAAEILKKFYEKNADTGIKTLLCFTLSSTGTEQDIQFLIRSLAGKHYGSEWPPIQQAAISLGILRAKEAKRPLEQSAAKEEGFASEAADSALKWIDGDIYSVTPGPNVSTRDSVILSLIRFGIPRMDEAAAFLEKESNRVWRREGNTWVYETSADVSPDNIPSIEFQVHIAPDLKRAICSVGLTFGRLNGSGYDFVLHKNAGGWKVIGVMPTWVS